MESSIKLKHCFFGHSYHQSRNLMIWFNGHVPRVYYFDIIFYYLPIYLDIHVCMLNKREERYIKRERL